MTYEELKAAKFVLHHNCAACGSPVGFEVHPQLAAACFNSGCNCGGPFPSYHLLTHEELEGIEAPVQTGRMI